MLKFADTAEAMGNFPVALANGIEITKKDDTKKSLQAMYDDGELGGGEGLPLPEQAGMVMMTYENEEGDLDWKQSLLKTVEKVDEAPTTFEDKVYVINMEKTGKGISINPAGTHYSLTEAANLLEEVVKTLDTDNNINIRKDVTTSGYKAYVYLDYDDNKYNLKLESLTIEQTFEHIHLLGYISGAGGEWFWDLNGSQKEGKITPNVVTLTLFKNNAQVYASEVELATKEYADTHGAGAQVYTKAEWNALPVKPPAGTQVIISDDTSGGSGGGESIANAIKVLNIKVQNSEYANGMDLSDKVAAAMPEGYQFLTWTHVSSNGWVTEYPIYCSNAGNTKGFPWTATNNITGMPKESDKTISFFCLVVKK